MSVPVSLATLAQQTAAAYYRHAFSPGVLGPAAEHGCLWLTSYEARNAAQEGNPAFATTLLPASGDADPLPLSGPGLPLFPAGVRAVADDVLTGSLTVSLEVSGAATLTVLPPGTGAVAFSPVFTAGPTRATVTFPAFVDGLYQLTLAVGGNQLALVYVSVERALWKAFREQVRALRFAFHPRKPRLTPALLAFLARLACAEAAAAVGDQVVYAQLIASAKALPVASSPVALYPDRNG